MMISEKLRPKLTVRKFTEEAVDDYIKKLDDMQYAYPEDQPILVHIDSYGGAVHSLLMLLDRLSNMPNPIVTYTSSKAMSCGQLLLSIAGTPGMRYASEDADILVHEVSAGAFGDIKDIEDRAKYIKKLNERVQNKLAKAIGKKNAKEVRQLIKENAKGHDLFLSAQKAKELGLIDEVASINIEPIKEWKIVKS
jgi:ATP-dependent Clp protease protease subunit